MCNLIIGNRNMERQSYLFSDELNQQQGETQLGNYQCFYYFQPFDNTKGGDRFSCHLTAEGSLSWYIADMSGHGEKAFRLWEINKLQWDNFWQDVLKNDLNRNSLVQFATRCNDLAYFSKSQICLAAGIWWPRKTLEFGLWGYGAHTLVRTKNKAWWPSQSEKIFDLKLGWRMPQNLRPSSRNTIFHTIDQVDRIILMTDAFLGDDYVDISATMDMLREMNNQCTKLESQEIIPYFLKNFGNVQDDATLIVIECLHEK